MSDVRLIDANALEGNRQWFDCHACGDECEIDYVDWQDIEKTPTIDAVPVVRCKDCKRCTQGKSAITFGRFCERFSVFVQTDDFCSFGERSENNERKAD